MVSTLTPNGLRHACNPFPPQNKDISTGRPGTAGSSIRRAFPLPSEADEPHSAHVCARIQDPSSLTLRARASYASSLTAGTILNDFNAVVYTNASTPSDIEGAAVIGGNFNGASCLHRPDRQPALRLWRADCLRQHQRQSQMLIMAEAFMSAAAKAPKSTSTAVEAIFPLRPNTIGNFEAPLNGLSNSLSTLAATGALPAAGNNEVITAHRTRPVSPYSISQRPNWRPFQLSDQHERVLDDHLQRLRFGGELQRQ